MIDDEDWVVQMCDFLDRWSSGARAALVFGVLGIGLAIPWVYGGIRSIGENANAYQRAISDHIRWLNGMPDAEKKRWPVDGICRPSNGYCGCPAYGDEVSYLEVLANGDVACHRTK